MCAIAGTWGPDSQPSGHVVESMLAAMTHRGPDGQGMATVGAGTIGHRRLSIVDLEGGAQPLIARDRVLIGNGELYDAPELRDRIGQAHTLVSGSDNEVALHLWASHGPHVGSHLDGMFAIGLVDAEDLLLLRDPVGIKPLYVGQHDGGWIFASELKALPSGVASVRPISPGETWSATHGTLTTLDLPDVPVADDASVRSHVAAVRASLERAVRRRLMADVPVGAFLSGGLDSSAIAALVAQEVEELHTFTVGVQGSPDLAAARAVARHIGSVHHERILTREDLASELPRVLWAMESDDPDLVRSAVPTYLTAELAAQHVKVVLTGEGADELFAGYRYMAGLATDDIPAELRRAIADLHAVNLQRVDRMTMAHSLEARVPFLDLDLIRTALAIPPSLVHAAGGRPEKWVLREAVSDLLPQDVVWRAKDQFATGSGAADLLHGIARDLTGEATEAAAYRRLLVDAYDDPGPVLANVIRWRGAA